MKGPVYFTLHETGERKVMIEKKSGIG